MIADRLLPWIEVAVVTMLDRVENPRSQRRLP